MDHLALLSELKQLGTEQNQKIYKKHGVKGELYGVSFANLEKLKKKIKINHQLAEKLWESANHDARVLATMIADPKQASDSLLESWLSDIDNPPLSDLFSTFASKTSFAEEKMEKWISLDSEWVSHVGWNLLARLATSEKNLADEFFEKYLEIIEKEIHSKQNFVKQVMNNTLIAIGVINSNLEEKALAVAAKIGKVEVDHGETGCKTPDAAQYIKKTIAYREQKAAKVKEKASKAN